jgi:hypothetical protein
MLKNMLHNISTLSITIILSMLIQSNCYAGFITTISETSVKCSPTPEEAKPQIYPGRPHTYLKLVTKGIKTKIDGQNTLIGYQDCKSGDVFVIAQCITPTGDSLWTKDMFVYSKTFSEPPTLSCRGGEGISITMYKPNDSSDPDKYQHVADLIKDRRVRDKQSEPTILDEPNKLPQHII